MRRYRPRAAQRGRRLPIIRCKLAQIIPGLKAGTLTVARFGTSIEVWQDGFAYGHLTKAQLAKLVELKLVELKLCGEV